MVVELISDLCFTRRQRVWTRRSTSWTVTGCYWTDKWMIRWTIWKNWLLPSRSEHNLCQSNSRLSYIVSSSYINIKHVIPRNNKHKHCINHKFHSLLQRKMLLMHEGENDPIVVTCPDVDEDKEEQDDISNFEPEVKLWSQERNPLHWMLVDRKVSSKDWCKKFEDCRTPDCRSCKYCKYCADLKNYGGGGPGLYNKASLTNPKEKCNPWINQFISSSSSTS